MNRILSAIPSSSRSTMIMARPAARSALSTPFVRSTISSARLYSTRPTPEGLDEGERNIYDKLSAKFPGKTLEVQDVSGGCGSFYAIEISSSAFKGLSTIKQHKLVNSCLKEDIKTIHGLQLKTIPEE